MSITIHGNTELTPQEEAITIKLRKMRLSGMAEEVEKQLLDPNSATGSFTDRITRIVDNEWNMRTTKKINKLLKKAALKYPYASLDDRIYDPARQLNTPLIEELSKCEWLEHSKNLIITGATGTGKTYMCNIFGVLAVNRFKTVFYYRASALMNNMEKHVLDGTALNYQTELAFCDLLIIDDFGLMELSVDHSRYLLEVLDSREARKPTIVASQFPVSSWYDLFKDNTYADACLDRLVNGAYRIDMKGESLRKA